MTNIQTLQSVISSMDVPSYKMDLEKDQNVLWLIENLVVRNRTHVRYPETMRDLINIARQRNLMKQKKLDTIAANFPV